MNTLKLMVRMKFGTCIKQQSVPYNIYKLFLILSVTESAPGAVCNSKRQERGVALLNAAEEGNVTKVQELIGCSDVDINLADDKYGWTPLLWAAEKGHEHVVKSLIDAGADINKARGDGWTALHIALYWGRENLAKTLIESGADINRQDNFLTTPLHVAASKGLVYTVKLLIDGGADINKVQRDGRTPLHDAAEEGHAKVAKILTDAGANILKEDRLGLTPVDYVVENDHESVGRVLYEARYGKIPNPFWSWTLYKTVYSLVGPGFKSLIIGK